MRILILLFSLLLLYGCTTDYKYTSIDYSVLENVVIIDGLGNPPKENQFIVIKDSVIVEIGDTENKNYGANVRVLSLDNKFVIPGLIDLHAHVTVLPLLKNGTLSNKIDTPASTESLKTFLKYGITTVRNPGAPTEHGIWLRDQVKSGNIIGPRIFTSGEALNRTNANFGPFVEADTFEKIEKAIDYQAAKDVDYIKVYASLNPSQLKHAIEYAHKKGLKVIGHLQRASWTEAAKFGIDYVSHAAPWSADYLPEEFRKNYTGNFKGRMDWIEKINLAEGPILEMAELLANRKIIVDPTLIAMHTKFWGDDEMYLSSDFNKLSHQTILNVWENTTFVDNWTKEDFERAKTLWPKLLDYIKLLYDKGVMLAAGSDFPNPWINPGISLHQELKLLSDCGIPNSEIIKIATYNGAVALDLQDKIGSIEKGKIADLIILDENPISHIESTRSILKVVKEGKIIEL